MTKRCARVAVWAIVFFAAIANSAAAQQLEIHYINVGWGNSVLVKGPGGTTVLLDAGNTGKGTAYVVPYLKSIGIQPANGLDYTIASHQHCDHQGGMDEVINGSENYTLYNAAGALVDGATVSMSSSAGQSIQRKDPCLPAGSTSSWNILASSSGTPGSGAAA